MSLENERQARLLIAQALQALKAGSPASARTMAESAAKLAPELEEPWLVLAAASSPAESLEYLQQALKVNPSSQRARQGIHWAVKRIREEKARQAAAVQPAQPIQTVEPTAENTLVLQPAAPAPLKPAQAAEPIPVPLVRRQAKLARRSRTSLWIPLFIVLAAVCLAGLVWIGVPFVRDALANEAAARPAGVIFKPSLTPTNTATNTPTATFTSTPTATYTPTPTDTPTPTPTDTPTPLPTDTPVPTDEVVVNNVTIPAEVNADTHWVDVNLSQQAAYAYQGETLVRSFIVSTGTYLHPTVTGQYHVYVKYRYADMSGPGYYLPDVPYVMYFYEGYGLHGTYWHNNFGTPMSHGCVNFRTEDAGWLYDFLPLGALVNVHY